MDNMTKFGVDFEKHNLLNQVPTIEDEEIANVEPLGELLDEPETVYTAPQVEEFTEIDEDVLY